MYITLADLLRFCLVIITVFTEDELQAFKAECFRTFKDGKRMYQQAAAIAMAEDLRKEFYFGENAPLVCDEHGEFTKPVNFRKRFLRILKAAHLPEYLSLHSFRHTYATRLGNGVKQPDGTILRLSPKQIANLLGHSTSEVTEMYYIRNDPTALEGITDGFDV